MSTSSLSRAQAIVQNLGGHWHGSYGLCRCPAHEDRTPSLRVAPGTSQVLVHCFAGCNRNDVLRAIKRLRLMPSAADDVVRPPAGSTTSRWLAQRLWEEGKAIQNTPAETYLRRRSITSTSLSLRFHPRLFVGHRRQGASFPALMAAITTDEGLVALQRTFLTIDGHKAPIEGARRMLCSPGKGAVRLSAPRGGQLGLAEGIETALSAEALHAIPCWATCGVENFAKVAIPQSVHTLWLFLDNGLGGDRAENLIRTRTDVEALLRACRPREGYGDWNDMAIARAAQVPMEQFVHVMEFGTVPELEGPVRARTRR